MKTQKKSRALELFFVFLKFGCFTFGGGWSIVAQIQTEFVEKRAWISDEELLDFTSVGRSIPGLMIGNTSVIFGYHVGGFLGAAAALLGTVIPPFVVMMGVVFAYNMFRDNLYVARAMMGVRAAVVPIILCALSKMFKSAMKDWVCYAIALGSLVLSLFTGVSNVLIVILGGLIGLMIMEVQSRRDLR